MEMTMPLSEQPRIAVLIPCYNEELTVGRVVRDFRRQVAGADIYVFDNGSIDRTRAEAIAAGAMVHTVAARGKGNVVRAMFASVNADVYVLVDGDATYPARSVAQLIAPVLRCKADMVVGSRLHMESRSEFRVANRLGNALFAMLLSVLARKKLTDVLSGYRVFSRRFVQSVHLQSTGFEIEAELTIAAIAGSYAVREVPVDLTPRPSGSHSKIRIASDGLLILRTILVGWLCAA
jgi:glycosyltransferase involved in cell wall biosynthesis